MDCRGTSCDSGRPPLRCPIVRILITNNTLAERSGGLEALPIGVGP
jgi:hypothetical protein